LRESKRRGVPTLGIVNVVASSIARESNGGIYLHAGPEIGVAATKTFSCQVAALTLLAVYLGRLGRLSHAVGARILGQLRALPDMVGQVLEQNDRIRAIAKKYAQTTNMLFLGRGYNFPIALEGALKLKEVSYIHAEGYPAAELKHGPIALIDKNTPTVLLNPRCLVYGKMMSTLEEVKARRGPIIAVATEGDDDVARRADDVIWIPETADSLLPILTVVPLQLLAYHMAVLRGCDVDKPRNLAKSVTVE
jgi:glucosamine--fructose-6-phosphate aminotransferase (isomerizing)